MNYIARVVGNCLTEYKHENYDSLIKNYNRFVLISQHAHPYPKALQEFINSNNNTYGFGKILDTPKCGDAQILFGVADNGDLTKLISIIDSGD